MPELVNAPSEEDVMEALSNVIDPELGLDFVELGLIYGIEIDGGNVHVTCTLTTPACPIGPQVTEQIEEFVSELDGVESVESTMTFTPPWTPDNISDDAEFALALIGVAVPAAHGSVLTGRLLVTLAREHPGRSAHASANAVLARARARRTSPLLTQLRLFTVRPAGGSLHALATRLRADPSVAAVQVERRATIRPNPGGPAL